MIKHMSFTEEHKLIKEYIDARRLIERNYPVDSALGNEGK